MARNKILRVRLSDEEWERLENYAKSKDYTLTEVIRDYVKRLPKIHPAIESEGLLLDEK